MRGKKFFQKIILGIIILGLFFPQLVPAQTEIPENFEKYLKIPDKDAQDILKSLPRPFYNEAHFAHLGDRGVIVFSLEGIVLLTFQKFLNIDTWNYFTREVPLEISFKIVEYGIKAAKMYFT